MVSFICQSSTESLTSHLLSLTTCAGDGVSSQHGQGKSFKRNIAFYAAPHSVLCVLTSALFCSFFLMCFIICLFLFSLSVSSWLSCSC